MNEREIARIKRNYGISPEQPPEPDPGPDGAPLPEEPAELRVRSIASALPDLEDPPFPTEPPEKIGDRQNIARVLVHDNTKAEPTNHKFKDWQRLSDVRELPVKWLWKPRIAFGYFTLIEGDGEAGKSTSVADLVARVTTGRPFPGETEAREPRAVIWIASEENANLLRQKLRVAGANLDLVYVRSDDAGRWLTDEGAAGLGVLIREVDAAVVVIDALKDHMRGSDNEESEVRRALIPIIKLAALFCVVIIGIRHWSKAPKAAAARGGGSTAFRNLPRSVLVVGKLPDGSGRALAHEKSNLALHAPTLAFRLESFPGESVPIVVWGGEIDTTADDLAMHDPMAERRAGEGKAGRGKATERAMEALRTVLASGPKQAKEAEEMVIEMTGVSEHTVRLAREKLRVVVIPPGGFQMPWYWRLPDGPANVRGAVENGDKSSKSGRTHASDHVFPDLGSNDADNSGGTARTGGCDAASTELCGDNSDNSARIAANPGIEPDSVELPTLPFLDVEGEL